LLLANAPLLIGLDDALPLRGWLYDLMPWERFSRHGSQRKDLAQW